MCILNSYRCFQRTDTWYWTSERYLPDQVCFLLNRQSRKNTHMTYEACTNDAYTNLDFMLQHHIRMCLRIFWWCCYHSPSIACMHTGCSKMGWLNSELRDSCIYRIWMVCTLMSNSEPRHVPWTHCQTIIFYVGYNHCFRGKRLRKTCECKGQSGEVHISTLLDEGWVG